MARPGRRLAGAAALGLLLALGGAPAFAQLSLSPPGAPPTPTAAEEETADPYGRETPRGCLLGFLRASQQDNLRNASSYLQIPSSLPAQREAIAHELQVVFDHRLVTSNFERLSRGARGNLDDGLDPDLEKVGELRSDEGLADVMVVRVPSRDASGHVWLISWPTVQQARRLYASLDLADVDQRVPALLAKPRIAGMALWRALAIVLLVPLLYGIAWLAVSAFLAAVRLVRRKGGSLPWAASAKSPATFLVTLVLHRAAMLWIGLPALYRVYYDRVLLLLGLIGLLWLLSRLIDNLNRRVLVRFVPAGSARPHSTVTLASRSMKIAAFLVVLLIGLAAFGVNLTATLAGLGIGGLALAFAAQKTLANLFGGVAVLSEKALRIGDTCQIAGRAGEVEDVTLWSTRIRTNERTVVSIPNGVVMESQIENLSRRDKFWFHPIVGLVYGTSAAQMRQVLEGIRALLASDPRVEPDDARVRFLRLAESSLDVEVSAYVRAASHPEFLAVQEELLLRILDVVGEAGTAIAFPSRTVYLPTPGAGAPA